MKTLVLAALLLTTFSLSSLAEQRFVTCDLHKSRQSITVNAELLDEIVVSAAGNPTTGYEWISLDGLEGQYESDDSGKIGSGGIYSFRILAKKSEDRKTFSFEYKRRWEPRAISQCLVHLNVR